MAVKDRAAKDRLGEWGEDLAAGYLQRAGLTVLARNWRCVHGELDIVATEGSTVVFCEVKTRSGVGFGPPAEAVVAAKVRRIRRSAAAWLAQAGRGWPDLRFDVVSVVRPAAGEPIVEHVRGAF
jgi:putative endonuclease